MEIKNLCFFGVLRLDENVTFFSVFKSEDGALCLNAGHIHDIQEGDEFAIYPFDTSEALMDPRETSVRFRIDAVGCLISNLKLMDPMVTSSQIDTGWKARLVKASSTFRIPVRLTSTIKDHGPWIECMNEASKKLHYAGNKGSDIYLFAISCNNVNEYEILDPAENRIMMLDCASANEENAKKYILTRHTAAFSGIQALRGNHKPNSSF